MSGSTLERAFAGVNDCVLTGSASAARHGRHAAIAERQFKSREGLLGRSIAATDAPRGRGRGRERVWFVQF